MSLKFNPFSEYGVTDYKDYQRFPFLESQSIKRLKNKANSNIRDGFRFHERLLILGESGIGKTSSLFYIHDLLKDSKKCNVFFLSKLFIDAEDFKRETGEEMGKVTENPTYILVDFPDTIKRKNFNTFLDYLWNLFTYKNYQNINLIFALNRSHYNNSFNFSEIFGKFDKFRLERMNLEESNKLINSRLNMASCNNFFEEEVYNLIFRYSKGIPRNIICASKNLVDEFFNESSINLKMANQVFKEEYIGQIINDRVDDLYKRLIYKKIIEIIDKDFGGEVKSQEEIIKKSKEKIGIGRNKTMNMISSLNRFGLLTVTRGGVNNSNKIITLK